MIEIPLPTGPVPASLSTAVQRLEEARGLLAEGKTDDVVTKCRKALEILNPLVSVQANATSGPPFQRTEPGLAAKIDAGSPGQVGKEPKSERVEGLRQALWLMAHIGPHEGYQVFPEDARAVFLVTTALIRHYADYIAR